MTFINPYGVGAGRMVSAASDDEDSRARPRRLTAAQLSAQSRNRTAMHEQLVQAERAAVMAEVAQRQHESADRLRREPATETTARRAGRRPAQAEPMAARPSAAAQVAGRRPVEPTAEQPAQRDIHDQPASVADNATRHPDNRPKLLVEHLVDALPGWRIQSSSAELERRLDALRESVLRLRSSFDADSREDLEAMAGSLEFAQGYLEASRTPGDAGQRLVLIIDGIRQDIGLMLSPGAGSVVGAMPAITAAAQTGSEAVRLQQSRKHRLERTDGAPSKKPAGEGSDEEDGLPATTGAPAGSPVCIDPVNATVPSQARDSEKRRNDTPVSVAVRSL
ncbi:MAG: hypothetical protein NBV65_06560 [Burkholderiaceae bacterium]|nr:hypothetical protein [Burkholderiaceae bacterium]